MATSQTFGAARAVTGADLRVYAMDGALLGLFMVSACVSVALVEHPASPLRPAIPSDFVRRALVGLAMGATAGALIYSPWGKRSGALMNPALTLAFVRLGKLEPRRALGYVTAQFAGGTLGVALSALVLGPVLRHPAVNYVVTTPGRSGIAAAWLAEFAIAFVMLTVVASINRVPRLAPHTGWFAAALVALFITFESPLSGMSLNPARSFASAAIAGTWSGFWIYATAPVAGVFSAVELVRRFSGSRDACGKLNHAAAIARFLECGCLERKRSDEA
jgi:aquaporin Z